MAPFLMLSAMIDRMNASIGRTVTWLILVMVLISSGNAMVRYTFNNSSNAWLEVQWYLFSAVFLLCSAYTLLKNEHIRIDVVVGRFSPRTQAWIDVIGTLLFLMPMAGVILWLSIPVFVQSLTGMEQSSDAGGLIRWPVKLMIPLGFTLLLLQGLSELIKKIAFLTGATADAGAPAHGHHGGDQ
ncbi:TRAP-type mannitol/chloroaromatic compound transport system, small permease component [Magnetospirillum sp. LM-5]|nr:TRAP-type mannitol/chloroaromatic compound transport system, small permease component [Magnetospirillum sp. LM-5]